MDLKQGCGGGGESHATASTTIISRHMVPIRHWADAIFFFRRHQGTSGGFRRVQSEMVTPSTRCMVSSRRPCLRGPAGPRTLFPNCSLPSKMAAPTSSNQTAASPRALWVFSEGFCIPSKQPQRKSRKTLAIIVLHQGTIELGNIPVSPRSFESYNRHLVERKCPRE